MKQKTKTTKHYCRHCGTEYNQPDVEYGKPITAIYCPICLSKKKRRKMIKVKDDK